MLLLDVAKLQFKFVFIFLFKTLGPVSETVEESEYSCQRSANFLLDLYPPSNGIYMPGVSQRASRIFIRRARTATEACYANYFSVCII